MRELVITSTSEVIVEVIPGNGDCLFAAILHQCYRMDVTSDLFMEMVKNFRFDVVMFLRQNCYMLRLQNCIISRIATDFPPIADESYEEKVLRLTEFLLIRHKWGGEEVIMATTEMMNVAINILYESGIPYLFNPSSGRPTKTLTIVFRLANGSTSFYDHYDSFISESPLIAHAALTTDRTRTYDKEVSKIQRELNVGVFSLPATSQTSDWSLPDIKFDDKTLCICTYNVRGCNSSNKQEEIDLILYEAGIHVACLQETKMVGSRFQSSNYIWNLASDEKLTMSHRGTAILISKGIPQSSWKSKKISGDIMHLDILLSNVIVHIVNVYIPSDVRSSVEFNLLSDLILKVGSMNVVIVGDFNAHIGLNDSTPSDAALIGNNLYHDVSDANGEALRNFLHLHLFQLKNSFAKSRTLRTTWRCGMRVSQIDYVLFSPMLNFNCSHISAEWTNLKTDH